MLEQFIIKRAEKRLQPYRAQAAVIKQKRATEYQKYLPQITEGNGVRHQQGYQRSCVIWRRKKSDVRYHFLSGIPIPMICIKLDDITR